MLREIRKVTRSAQAAPSGTTRPGAEAHADGAYRPDIDGLRAVAVLSVVVFHAFPAALPGGFVGVDVFFAISGFLITGILLRQHEPSIGAFYVRRIRRIFPALGVVLASVLGLGWLLLLPTELAALGRHTVAGALSVANVQLYRDAGYFAAASRLQPLLHLWSLGVEEQFYLVWPWCVLLLRGRARFMTAVLTLAALSLVASVVWTPRDPAGAFYLPFTRLWELALGGALAALSPRLQLAPRTAAGIGWLGVGLLAAGFGLTRETGGFPSAWPLFPVLGSLLLMAAGPTSLPSRVLGSRPAVAIGLISYPLYLWHWPLLAFGAVVLGELSVGVRVAAVLAAVALATLTYRVVELPIRTGRARWGRPLPLVAALTCVAAVGGFVYLRDGVPDRVPQVAVVEAPFAQPPLSLTCPPSLRDGGLAALNYCRLSTPRDRTEEQAPPVAALLGDSHAERLFDSLVREDGRRWLLLGNSSCPPLQGVRTQTEQPGCPEKFQRILRYLASPAGAQIEVVYLSYYNAYGDDSDFSANHMINHYGPSTIAVDGHKDRATKQQLFEQGLDAYISALEALHKRVVVIEDVPEFPFFPSECALRPPAGNWLRQQLGQGQCALERARVDARQAWYLQMHTRIAARHPALRVVHTLDLVCSGLTCGVRAPGGDLLYDDSHHLSAAGARRIAARMLDLSAAR
ncbi:MAG: acyltransferase family protein [Polyangiales bacterium]